MSAKAVLNLPHFEDIGEENEYLKNLVLQLFNENKKLREQINSEVKENKKRPESESSQTDSNPARKRIKKDSLDPLDFTNICEDIQGLLMQHFSGKDLLKMSEVSKAWNNLVRAEIPKKTILNLSKMEPYFEDNEVTLKINTKFNDIVMSCEDFTSVPVSLFSNSVEKLKITYKDPKELIFSKLKSLELHFTLEHLKWFPQLRMDELEELKITNRCVGYPDCVFCFLVNFTHHRETWIEIFEILKNLKHLEVGNCDRSFSLFLMGKDQLKLETLKFKYPAEGSVNRVVLFRTLKKVTVIEPWEISYAFDEDLTELTRLEIEDYIDLSFERELSISNTIKHLSIKLKADEDIFGIDFTNVKKLLKSCPKLETFYVTKLTKGLMKFVACTNMEMQTVQYSEIEKGTLRKYNKICLKLQNINRDIQFITEN